MKAWVLYKANDIRWEERETPIVRDKEVLVRVEAVGICGSDIPRIYDTGAHVHPLVPGHEFSGTVVESADSTFLGKRVGVFPLLPCKSCDMCRQKQYEMCRSYSYLGSRCDGAFAQYVCLPSWNLITLPEEVSFEAAACLEPLAVVVHAVRRAMIVQKDSVLVIGFGTIGMLLVSVLVASGIKNITVVGNKEIQRNRAQQMNIPFKNVREVSATDFSANVVFECVGSMNTAAMAIESAAPNGRVVMVGNPRSDMSFSRETYWKILRKQLMVLGTWNSSFTKDESDDWHYALTVLKNDPHLTDGIITHRFPLEDLEVGLHIMRDKTEDYGKVMIVR